MKSVCSFIYSVFKNITTNTKKMYFLMQQGAKSKLYCFAFFIIYVKFNFKITQIFPVRGHSYCVYDRNFGVLSKLTKNLEVVEFLDDLDIFKKYKKFDFVKGVSYNFEESFRGYFCNINDIQVFRASNIKIYPNGIVKSYDDYSGSPYVTKNLIKKNKNLIDCKHGVDAKKREDVLKLVKFLKPKNRDFLNKYLNSIPNKLK